ncbi:LuxR family transcriptional regulator [Massilia sp. Root351]|jgi:DNA-binding NarL/FixJ family response regulator|uniref:response regulator n=1 Tax=Massilia sp. Root351 TaxID=1736522 RepID=UPI00070F4223|nr:response regulator transcription factor [Massilia sp. Root351]KQV84961.1 LuxR family transcriptional regulator [Massilia sp. Root351]
MTSGDTISVLIADDHPLLRSGIAGVLTSDPRFCVVGEADDGIGAVELFRQFRPAITLMDLQMPGLNGIDATKAIRHIDPEARIIILTTFDGDVQVTRSLQAGASGYILKNLTRTDLIDYILSIHAGGRQLPPQVASSLAGSFQSDSLSKREIEVLRLVAGGNTNQRVADELGLREDTIKAHMKAILQKLGARDRTHAVMIAMRRGYWEG